MNSSVESDYLAAASCLYIPNIVIKIVGVHHGEETNGC